MAELLIKSKLNPGDIIEVRYSKAKDEITIKTSKKKEKETESK